MEKQLEILEEHLKISRPEFLSKLNSPLTENEIKLLEEKFNLILPGEIKTLYQWKNGQPESCFKSFVNNSMFMTLEDCLSTSQELTSMIGSDFEIENWWNKDWLPIFSNGGGSYICYDTGGTFTGQKGQLIEFWKADNDRNIIAADLKSFVIKLNEFYSLTPVENFDGFFEVEKSDGFPKKFIVE